MNNTLQYLFPPLLLALLSLTLLGCSGGGDSTSSTNAGDRGTVGVLLTDAPADPDIFQAIHISIDAVELLGGDDSGRVTLYEGDTTTLDLLRLRNESIPFSFNDDVPAGEYCKVRLTLSDLELVFTDETPLDHSDNPTYHPRLPGNNKLDLNVRDCFELGAGETLTLQLDIDANRSIHVTQNGNNTRYQFRPVVFVDAIVEEFDPKLLRLEGTLVSSDQDTQQLLLCAALPTVSDTHAGCVTVALNDDSAYFDNLSDAGAPRDPQELFDADKLGTSLTIVGWPRRPEPFATLQVVPESAYPEAGMCIVWDWYLPATEQALAIDCDSVPETLPAHSVVVTHEGVVGHALRPLMHVDALVAEAGAFSTYEGEASTDASATGFDLQLQPADPTLLSDLIRVALQPGSEGINGTRIVSKAGELLDDSAINLGDYLSVDGVLDVSDLNNVWLNAALVIVDTDYVSSEQASGTVSEVSETSVSINLGNSELCGNATSLLNVTLADVQVLTVTITVDSSAVSVGGSFETGQTVGINGQCQNAAFETSSIVIVDDQRTP